MMTNLSPKMFMKREKYCGSHEKEGLPLAVWYGCHQKLENFFYLKMMFTVVKGPTTNEEIWKICDFQYDSMGYQRSETVGLRTFL